MITKETIRETSAALSAYRQWLRGFKAALEPYNGRTVKRTPEAHAVLSAWIAANEPPQTPTYCHAELYPHYTDKPLGEAHAKYSTEHITKAITACEERIHGLDTLETRLDALSAIQEMKKALCAALESVKEGLPREVAYMIR